MTVAACLQVQEVARIEATIKRTAVLCMASPFEG